MVSHVHVYELWLLYLEILPSIGKYTLYTSSKNYYEAKVHCINQGERLVKICNRAILLDMERLAYGKSDEFWIGLTLDDTRPPTNTSYKYEDGEKAAFYRWTGDEPDSQLQHQCVRVSFKADGTADYRTRDCTKHYNFVCEQIEMTTSELTHTTTDDHELSSTTISPSTTIRHINDYSTACTCEMICTWESKEGNATSDREEEIRSALVVDKKSLSSTKRKLISAGDDRQSSTIIGYAGAIFISLVLFFIVIGDLISLLSLLFCNK